MNIANDIVIVGGSATGFTSSGLLRNLGTVAGESVTVSGDITINGSTGAGGGHFASTNGGTLNLTGSITSSVKVQQRDGMVVYSGGGSYAEMGVTGTATLGVTNGLATNATVDLGVSGAGTFDLAGKNQSLAGITKSTHAATVTNTGTSNSLLTVTGSSTYGGIITNGTAASLALDVNGGGYLKLTASNSYTGLTTVTAGTLEFAVSETLTGGLDIQTSGTAVLTAHTGTVKVLDITGLTISGTTAFAGGGGKDLGELAPAPVPEPGTIGMLAIGAIGGLLLRRRCSRPL